MSRAPSNSLPAALIAVFCIWLLVLAGTASAATVYIPGTVSGSSVPVVVDDLQGADLVNVTIDGVTKQLTGQSSIRADVLGNLPKGLHAWKVQVTSTSNSVSTTVTHNGFVHVVGLDGADASHARVDVPATVSGDVVPVVVDNLLTTDVVQVFVGQLSKNLTDMETVRAGIFTGLDAGLHPWRVNVTNVGGTATYRGYVHVNALAGNPGGGSAIESRIANLESQLQTAVTAANQASAAATQASNAIVHPNGTLMKLASRVDRIDASLERQEMTQTLAFSDLTSRLDSTNLTVGDLHSQQSRVAADATKASTTGIASTTLLVFALLALSGGVTFLWWSERARHKESMALLLAAAVRMGVTEDSDELKTALKILES